MNGNWLHSLQERLWGVAPWDASKISDEWFRAHFEYAADVVNHWIGGVLDVRMDVRNGVIADIRLFGDYFGVRDVVELEDTLCGCRHEREALKRRLALVHIDAYIQGVGERIFLDCLF